MAAVELINSLAVQIVELTTLTPLGFFIASLAVATALLLLDFNKDVPFSLNLPGSRRRLGAAASIIITGTVVSLVADVGVLSIFVRLRSELFSFGIVGLILIAFWFGRKG